MATKPAAPKNTEAPKTTRTAPSITAVGSVELPARANKRSGQTAYPFDQLTAPGMSFGVTDRDKKAVQSVVSNQNRKFKENTKDEAGNVVLKDGKPVQHYTIHYEVIDVTPEIAAAIKGTHLENAKTIVRRDK